MSQVSGYPNDCLEVNVSTDTTLREVLSIDGIPKEVFKTENINLMFGPVSHVQYCQTMMNFPTIDFVDNFITEKLKHRESN